MAFIDPGTASLLSKTIVLFGLGFGLMWLRERLTATESTGALIAIVGVFIITFQPGDYSRIGLLLVLVSTFLYALHAALVKRYSGHLDFTAFFLFRLASTTGFLFVFAATRGGLVWPGSQVWPLLALVGTVDVIISRALYYLALRRLKMSLHSIVLTLSPVATIVWSLLLFDSKPTVQQLIGGLGVMVGILVLTAAQA